MVSPVAVRIILLVRKKQPFARRPLRSRRLGHHRRSRLYLHQLGLQSIPLAIGSMPLRRSIRTESPSSAATVTSPPAISRRRVPLSAETSSSNTTISDSSFAVIPPNAAITARQSRNKTEPCSKSSSITPIIIRPPKAREPKDICGSSLSATEKSSIRHIRRIENNASPLGRRRRRFRTRFRTSRHAPNAHFVILRSIYRLQRLERHFIRPASVFLRRRR